MLQFGDTKIPLYFIYQTKIKTKADFLELENIWEAYKALLSQDSLKIVTSEWYFYSNVKYHSISDSLIDISKLYKVGKMYLDMNEIEKIIEG